MPNALSMNLAILKVQCEHDEQLSEAHHLILERTVSEPIVKFPLNSVSLLLIILTCRAILIRIIQLTVDPVSYRQTM